MSQEILLSRDLGYLRAGAAVPELKVADVDFNSEAILELVRQAGRQGVQVLAFPEMSITGYTLGDLVQHQALLSRAEKGLTRILAETSGTSMVTILGMPVLAEQRIFNAAVIINRGRILGVVPKTYLPDYKEFYDERWYESGQNSPSSEIRLGGQTVPFGTDLLFQIKGVPGAIFGVEICEDLWVPLAPHEYQAAAGALMLFNLSASNEVLRKPDWRRTMVISESGRCLSAYCYVSSGIGESSNDIVFGGHILMAENGVILKESTRLYRGSQLVISDIDLDRMSFDRRMSNTFQDAGRRTRSFRIIEAEVNDSAASGLQRTLLAHPFVPADAAQRAERCQEIFSMQVGALAKKLTGAGIKKIVLGVSGGLDSTLALLVAVKTMDFLNLPRTSVYTYTLPGFGTTRRTKNNATRLCRSLGVNFEMVNIGRTCKNLLADLGHKGEEDIVFENVQARYRTGFLFNKANQVGALNLGTGDLTEVALGWSTFAGDQVSNYHVNVSVPKTLVRFLVRWVADEEMSGTDACRILYDILETPISPELRRPKEGQIVQKSEDVIGPVELADFYLYPFIRFGLRPGKILYLANEINRQQLFEGRYTLDELHHWLQSFINRFFKNQFKRTCLPEGPKVGTVSLSPRGDWRMPSDASPGLWLTDLEEMYHKLK